MSLRNVELIKEFKTGATSGENHTGSMSIFSYPNGDTLLVGYDNAIYAHRNSDTGVVTKYIDWVYGSNTNKSHIDSFNADRDVKAQPQIDNNGKIKIGKAKQLERITNDND